MFLGSRFDSLANICNNSGVGGFLLGRPLGLPDWPGFQRPVIGGALGPPLGLPDWPGFQLPAVFKPHPADYCGAASATTSVSRMDTVECC